MIASGFEGLFPKHIHICTIQTQFTNISFKVCIILIILYQSNTTSTNPSKYVCMQIFLKTTTCHSIQHNVNQLYRHKFSIIFKVIVVVTYVASYFYRAYQSQYLLISSLTLNFLLRSYNPISSLYTLNYLERIPYLNVLIDKFDGRGSLFQGQNVILSISNFCQSQFVKYKNQEFLTESHSKTFEVRILIQMANLIHTSQKYDFS
eukprot:TRINITY_DN1463_c1_g1_i7.p1 TRINITY_DN1463_c1_g1~~TRINITY_DN1463_c1_g1_i7.p1  ORF type:complete len:205 (-),score=-24.40 TRINITY_DN1463_c1_g1_i7:278-892(-)